MKRVLITGMSGVGKSSVIGRLSELGYRALDVDDEGWSEAGPDGAWDWKADEVEAALDAADADGVPVLFLSGCAESQVRFYPRFDHLVLLTAPPDVIVQRLRTRVNNPYGQRFDDRVEVLRNQRRVEPLLRASADAVVDTNRPLGVVVERVLAAAGEPLVPARALAKGHTAAELAEIRDRIDEVRRLRRSLVIGAILPLTGFAGFNFALAVTMANAAPGFVLGMVSATAAVVNLGRYREHGETLRELHEQMADLAPTVHEPSSHGPDAG